MPEVSLAAMVAVLTERLRKVEQNVRSEVTGGTQAVLFADLPTPGQPGRLMWCSNGRKIGEGAGTGTGILVADDGNDWIHVATDTPATA